MFWHNMKINDYYKNDPVLEWFLMNIQIVFQVNIFTVATFQFSIRRQIRYKIEYIR